MSHHQSHHVTVDLQENYQFLVRFDDVEGTPTLTCDEPAPLGAGQGPNAAAVLGAAVGNCLAASLAFCLRKARIDLVSLRARVTTRIARNETGRFRVAGIDVVLAPQLGEARSRGTERCADLYEDFCTVTASIRNGIPVTVSLDTRQEGDDAKTAA